MSGCSCVGREPGYYVTAWRVTSDCHVIQKKCYNISTNFMVIMGCATPNTIKIHLCDGGWAKVSVPLNNGLILIYSKQVKMNEMNYTPLCNGDPFKAVLMLAVDRTKARQVWALCLCVLVTCAANDCSRWQHRSVRMALCRTFNAAEITVTVVQQLICSACNNFPLRIPLAIFWSRTLIRFVVFFFCKNFSLQHSALH